MRRNFRYFRLASRLVKPFTRIGDEFSAIGLGKSSTAVRARSFLTAEASHASPSVFNSYRSLRASRYGWKPLPGIQRGCRLIR